MSKTASAKVKKPIYKRYWVWFIVLSITFSIMLSESDKEKQNEPKPSEPSAITETSAAEKQNDLKWVPSHPDYYNALMEANLTAIKSILKDNPDFVNLGIKLTKQIDGKNVTYHIYPLMILAYGGAYYEKWERNYMSHKETGPFSLPDKYIAAAEYLLKKGANVNILGRDNMFAPLDIAGYVMSLPLCKLLIEHGANPNGGKSQSSYPLVSVCKNSEDDVTIAIICKYLISKGANVNLKKKHSPLYWAIKMKHIKTTQILLEAGADPTYKYSYHDTPLDIAKKLSQKGKPEFLKLISLHI